MFIIIGGGTYSWNVCGM